MDLNFVVGAMIGSGLFMVFGRRPAELILAKVRERLRL